MFQNGGVNVKVEPSKPSANMARRAAQPVVDRFAQAVLRDRRHGDGDRTQTVGDAEIGE